jgi:hypothetical protein
VFKHILSWNFVFSTMTIQGCTNLSLIIGNLGNWLKGALQVDATINGMLWSYWHGGNWAWFGIVRWNVICKILMCVNRISKLVGVGDGSHQVTKRTSNENGWDG